MAKKRVNRKRDKCETKFIEDQLARCHDRIKAILCDFNLMEFELRFVRDCGFTLKTLTDVDKAKNLTVSKEEWNEQGFREKYEIEKIPHTDGLDDGGAYSFYDSIKFNI